MKTKIILIGSFALNCALVAGLWVARHPQQTVASTERATETTDAPKTGGVRAKTKTETITVTRDKQIDWTSVESEDYRQYIANLREINCPEETVRDIIIADINKLYASKIAALYPSPQDFKFWKTERSTRTEERERDHKRRELEKEKKDLIKELLGVDYDSELARLSGRPEEDNWRYGFLSAEKQASVKALYDKFREMERSLFGEGGGWSSENRAKFASLRAQREAEMAALLTPQEFEEYQLRNSWTARNMRENLGSFEPSEDEFKKIFQMKKAYDDQFGFMRDGSDESLREQRRVAQAQLEEQMKAALGEQRYAEYQLSQDDRYRGIQEFGQRNNLTDTQVRGVYDVRVAAENERTQILADTTLTPDARAAKLQELANSTGAALAQTMGQPAWKDYQDNNRWLTRLTQVEDSGRDGGRDYRSRGFSRGR